MSEFDKLPPGELLAFGLRCLKHAEEKKIEIKHYCWICLDKGFVPYPIQISPNSMYYEAIARCKCKAGERYPKHPLITEVQDWEIVKGIEKNNRELTKPLDQCKYDLFGAILKEMNEEVMRNESVQSAS